MPYFPGGLLLENAFTGAEQLPECLLHQLLHVLNPFAPHLTEEALGIPVIHAVVLGIDPVTGRVVSLMDGTWLTALRTGAVGLVCFRLAYVFDWRRIGAGPCGPLRLLIPLLPP